MEHHKPPAARDDDYDPEREAQEVARARSERDRQLTPAARIERLHRLCAQLATSPPRRT